MTTTKPLPIDLDQLRLIFSHAGLIDGMDYTIRNVPGAPHAAAVTVNLTGLTSKIRRLLTRQALVLEPTRRNPDGTELVVASILQPNAIR